MWQIHHLRTLASYTFHMLPKYQIWKLGKKKKKKLFHINTYMCHSHLLILILFIFCQCSFRYKINLCSQNYFYFLDSWISNWSHQRGTRTFKFIFGLWLIGLRDKKVSGGYMNLRFKRFPPKGYNTKLQKRQREELEMFTYIKKNLAFGLSFP